MPRPAKGPLYIHRERLIGECRHRVVKRYSDMTYWMVSEYRNEMGKWLPMTVANQDGTQASAERKFFEATN
jgi:hypothetical protein